MGNYFSSYDSSNLLAVDRDDNLLLDSVISFAKDRAFRSTKNIEDAFSRACDCAHKLGLKELAEGLTSLPIPTDSKGGPAPPAFASRLLSLMIKHRDVGHEWHLTEIQEKQLDNFIYATSLLRECLELAFMPPSEKQAMLDSLYLPPERVDEE